VFADEGYVLPRPPVISTVHRNQTHLAEEEPHLHDILPDLGDVRKEEQGTDARNGTEPAGRVCPTTSDDQPQCFSDLPSLSRTRSVWCGPPPLTGRRRTRWPRRGREHIQSHRHPSVYAVVIRYRLVAATSYQRSRKVGGRGTIVGFVATYLGP